MTAFAALLRAVNVGGTGKLAMADLIKLCSKAGFTSVKTYIQSGNVVFSSKLGEAKVRATLEKALEAKMGKPVGVLVRTQAELEQTLANNPFKTQPTNRVIVLFMNDAPGVLPAFAAPGGEQVALVGREIFTYYPEGAGASKLKLPFAKVGTGRNLNTVGKLVALLDGL